MITDYHFARGILQNRYYRYYDLSVLRKFLREAVTLSRLSCRDHLTDVYLSTSVGERGYFESFFLANCEGEIRAQWPALEGRKGSLL